MRALLLIRAWALQNQLRLALRWLWHPLRGCLGLFALLAVGGTLLAWSSAPWIPADAWWCRPLVLGGATLAVFQLALNQWLFSKDLAFLPGEVAFVFPAPVSRAALLGSRLLFLQPAVLLAAAFFSTFIPAGPDERPRLILGLHLFFTFVHVNGLAASLSRVPHPETERASPLRVVVVLALGLCGGLVAWSFRSVQLGIGPSEVAALLQGDDGAFRSAASLLATWAAEQPQATAMAPFRALAELMAPAPARGLGALLPPALLVLLPPLLFVLLGRTHFLETALQATAVRQLRLEQVRAGHWRGLTAGVLPPPTVPLELFGGPTWALAWGNLAGLSRVSAARHAIDVALLLLLAYAVATVELLVPYRESVVMTLQGGVALTVFVAPDAGPLDLRGALRRPDWLRTLPVPGWRVLLAQAAANTLHPWALGSLLLGLAAIVAGGLEGGPEAPTLVFGLLGAVVALLPVVACGVLITNAAGLYWQACAVFPAVTLIQALGWYLVIFVRMVGGALLAAPAALAGGLLAAVGMALVGPVALLVGGVAFAVVFSAALAPIVVLGGRRLDTYEPPAT